MSACRMDLPFVATEIHVGRANPGPVREGVQGGPRESLTPDEKNLEPSCEVPLWHAFARSISAQMVPGSGNGVVSNCSRRYDVTDEVNA